MALTGHRDTHFRFLQYLRPGEALSLQSIDGTWKHYVVERSQVVDQEAVEVLAPTDIPTLTLVTCYPFDRLAVGGRQRFIVRAVGE